MFTEKNYEVLRILMKSVQNLKNLEVKNETNLYIHIYLYNLYN